MTYKGGCLCGAVSFEISGPVRKIVRCHCSQCRKAQGSAFATNGFVRLSDFSIIAGEDELTGYMHSDVQTRYFCKHCGSPIISKSTERPGEVRVRIGTIESEISERPEADIFVASKASWNNICGDLPCYDEFEPGR